MVAFGLSLLAAVPDALLALWLKLMADGVIAGRRGLVVGAAAGLGVFSGRHVVSARDQRPHPAEVPRPGDHSPGIACGAAASVRDYD